MLLSDFLTVAFIPSLIVSHTNSSTETGNDDPGENGGSVIKSFFTPSHDDDLFAWDDFPKSRSPSPPPTNSFPHVSDPVLRAIYEEETRLDLSGDDNEGMSSEEARSMINFQRNKLQNRPRDREPSPPAEQNRDPRGRFLFSSEGGSPFFLGPQNERIDANYFTSTQFPILLPSRDTDVDGENLSEEEMDAATTTAKPMTGRMGFGGVFNKVKTGIGSTVGNIRNTFWGSSQQTTTALPSPPDNMIFSGGSNNIVFGDDADDITVRPPEPVGVGNPICNGTQTEYKGACYNVLQQLPCPDGQWLIEDDVTGKGVCVENKCADQRNHAYFAGKCVRVRYEGDCTTGMTTYIYKNGEVECDCKEQYLFNQRDGNCYPSYRRGPCRSGEVLISKLTALGTLPATCVRSKCSKDGFFCNAPSCPNDRNCVELKSKCSNGVFDIDPTTLRPKCLDINVFRPDRIIGNVPTLACAPGSRRDILGTCRKPTRISFS